MTRYGRAMLALTAVALTACSTTTAGDATAIAESPVPTTTTRVPRVTDNSDRPQIAFDPCLDIPDDVLIDLGYKATAKDEVAFPKGDYSFLGCGYMGIEQVSNMELPRYSLSIMSANVTLDEELAKNGEYATPAEINGRRALLEIDVVGEGQCAYVVETDFGIVLYDRLVTRAEMRVSPSDTWCSGLKELVTALEPYIALAPGA